MQYSFTVRQHWIRTLSYVYVAANMQKVLRNLLQRLQKFRSFKKRNKKQAYSANRLYCEKKISPASAVGSTFSSASLPEFPNILSKVCIEKMTNISLLTWINWIVKADFPTPPPPTTTSRYFSCTEPSFHPAIEDTLTHSPLPEHQWADTHFSMKGLQLKEWSAENAS